MNENEEIYDDRDKIGYAHFQLFLKEYGDIQADERKHAHLYLIEIRFQHLPRTENTLHERVYRRSGDQNRQNLNNPIERRIAFMLFQKFLRPVIDEFPFLFFRHASSRKSAAKRAVQLIFAAVFCLSFLPRLSCSSVFTGFLLSLPFFLIRLARSAFSGSCRPFSDFSKDRVFPPRALYSLPP